MKGQAPSQFPALDLTLPLLLTLILVFVLVPVVMPKLAFGQRDVEASKEKEGREKRAAFVGEPFKGDSAELRDDDRVQHGALLQNIREARRLIAGVEID